MEEKEIISEKINEIPIESSQIVKKQKKKIKKKEKKNFKGLKDLLDNIKDINKTVTSKMKKTKNNKKENDNKEKEEIEINNNINIDSGNNILDIEEIKNENVTKYFSTSFSNLHEYNTNDTQNDKIELLNKENKVEIPKINRQNFILKKIEINNEIDNNLLNNREEEKSNNSKIYSPMCEYYQQSENKLINMFTNVVDYKNSINYVEKNKISENEFNFHNDKFIKKNMFNKMKNMLYNNYNNSNNFDINNLFNLDLNNTNNYINNCGIITNFNNIYYPNNLNINLICNNIYFNGNENNNINNLDNKFNDNQNNKFDNDKNIKSNIFYDINNYILQKAFSFDENTNSKEKKEKSKILEKLNFIFNSNNNMQSFNNPIIFNFTQNNCNYNFNNINNNNSYNNNNEFKKHQNKNNKYLDKNESNKKNTFCRRPNDWVCSKCYNLNFAFRIFCNRCSAPKELFLNVDNNY